MRRWLTAFITIFVAGCATPYEPMGDTGGYYQQRIGEHAYIVGFRGNGFTNYQMAYDFAVLRAVEIGEELKYRYFAIEGQMDKSKTTLVDAGSRSYTSGSLYGYGNSATYYGTTNTYSNQISVSKPNVELNVVYFEDKPKGRYLELYEISSKGSEIRTNYNLN